MATPDFVLRLRERVGTELLWLTGVTAVIVREQPAVEVLLVRRADTGAWTAVTGIIDPGETVADTARREALEEAGVVIEVERVVWLHTLPPMEYPNGDRAQYLDLVFACRWVSGDPYPADGENTEAFWAPVSDLPVMSENMRERVRIALADEPEARFER